MPGFKLSRRTVLRGAGGAAMALPALEIMGGGRARGADLIPKRFVLAYCGNSQPGNNFVAPVDRGASYQITPGLQPIADPAYGVSGLRNEIGIVSGLQVPWATNPMDLDRDVAGSVPPAGRVIGFHGSSTMPQLTGTKGERGDSPSGRGLTADQVVAGALRGNTAIASLVLRVPPTDYYGGGNGGGDCRVSHGTSGAIDPISSLRVAYSTLFGGTAALGSGGGPVMLGSLFDRRKSILDVVNGSAKRLMSRLGGEDRTRMEKHFQCITDLEKSIDVLRMKVDGSPACKRPAAPDDPSIGANTLEYVTDPNKPQDFSGEHGWSNEELRAQIMGDFIYIALACDLTRSVSWHLSMRQGSWNTFHVNGVRQNSHESSHRGGDGGGDNDGTRQALAELIGWHIKHLARVVGKLRDTQEADGTSLLNHAALCMFFEGGCGEDPEGKYPFSSHSTQNMVAIMAGRAGGLKAGQHIKYSNNKHPAQVALTMMNAVGVNGPLGEVNDPLPEMFSLQP